MLRQALLPEVKKWEAEDIGGGKASSMPAPRGTPETRKDRSGIAKARPLEGRAFPT